MAEAEVALEVEAGVDEAGEVVVLEGEAGGATVWGAEVVVVEEVAEVIAKVVVLTLVDVVALVVEGAAVAVATWIQEMLQGESPSITKESV